MGAIVQGQYMSGQTCWKATPLAPLRPVKRTKAYLVYPDLAETRPTVRPT